MTSVNAPACLLACNHFYRSTTPHFQYWKGNKRLAPQSGADEACVQLPEETGHPLGHRGDASWRPRNQRTMGQRRPGLCFSSFLHLQASQPRRPGRQVDGDERHLIGSWTERIA